MNKKIILLLLLTTSLPVMAKWNTITQPYEGVTIEIGDKINRLNNFSIFWTKFTSNNKHTIITQTAVDCNNNEYTPLFIEEDNIEKEIKDRSKPIKVKDGDILFYPISSICEKVQSSCKPDNVVTENLDRTLEEESFNILKSELFNNLDDNDKDYY